MRAQRGNRPRTTPTPLVRLSFWGDCRAALARNDRRPSQAPVITEFPILFKAKTYEPETYPLLRSRCLTRKLPTPHPRAGPTPALLGTRWALVRIDDTPLAVSSYSYDYNSYLQFAAGNQLLGLATCDAIQGQFALGSGSQQLTINQLTTIKGGCTSPTIASRYLAALPQTSRYTISHDTLRLYSPQGPRPRLVFQAAPWTDGGAIGPGLMPKLYSAVPACQPW
ncbi:MAG: META domain-containing protein [Hymenobacter sp.]